jgi:tripartite-type tricarboxylate transporter receptor subunit TctC
MACVLDSGGCRRDKEGLDPAHDERECPANRENDMHRTMFAASTILLALATNAEAQDWPTRPLTLVVPFSAGGGVDVSARIQAQRMGELLGQSILVENVGAAAGMAGGQRVAKAAPDGYTFLIGNSGTHAYNQSLYKKPLYNAASDFQPVGLVSESPRILIARKDLPANNLKEFIAYIKANESKIQFGSAGVGSGTHLPCVLFNLAIGANVTHVPYRGEGPVMQDLIGGRVDYMCATIQSGAGQGGDGQRHRGDVGEARADHPRSRHDRRAGPPRRRSERVECLLLPQGHTRPDRAQAQQGHERHPRRSGHP